MVPAESEVLIPPERKTEAVREAGVGVGARKESDAREGKLSKAGVRESVKLGERFREGGRHKVTLGDKRSGGSVLSDRRRRAEGWA